MRRLSMNEFSTFRWNLEEDIRKYSGAGYGGIGLWRRKLADFGEEQGIALLLESGLKVSNLLWAGGFTGSSGLTFQDSVEDALEAIRLGAAVRAGCVVLYSGGRNNHILRQAWRLLEDALRVLLPIAEMLDVKLAIEPMHPAAAGPWTFITSLDAAIDTVNRFSSRHFGFVLDLYHFGRDEAALERAVECVDQIAIVHLADSRRRPHDDQDRCLLGEGSIPIAAAVERLERAGYRGFYDVELVGQEIVPEQYDRVVDESRDTFARMCSAIA